MKTVSAGFQTHLNGDTALARLWRVTRVDGREFYFTDSDRDITFEGNVYESSVGYDATAIDNQSGLSVDNLEVTGFLSSDAITDRELRGGLWDYAEIRIGIVNYSAPTQGRIAMRRGRLGEVVYDERSNQFQAELRGLTQQYAQQIVELHQQECTADLGDERCKVPILPALWTPQTVYAVGDTRRFPVGDTVTAVTVTNASFEADAAGTTAITGWTSVGPGTPVVRTGATGAITGAQDGTNYVVGNGGTQESCSIEQTIDLTALFTDAQLDGGRLYPYLQFWRANGDATDSVRGRLQFLTAADALISEVQGDAANSSGAWDDERIGWSPAEQTAFPSGTRRVKILLELNRTAGNNDSAVDSVELFVRDRSAVDDVAQFGDVYYECTTAGSSSERIPPFVSTVGATVAEDGLNASAQWIVRDGWTRQATVATVTDDRVFAIAVTEPRAVDGWFTYGAVTFESGNNSGLSMEVKGWTQSTSLVELFITMPFQVTVGDRLRLYAGCDKRLTTCINKFDNVVNFRGFPYVPGQDEFLDGPDAR